MPKAEPTAKPAPVVRVAKPAPAPSVVRVAQPVAPSYGYSLKDDAYPVVLPEPTRGAWVQAFGDYERHTGWTLDGGPRGGLTSKQLTGGLVAGTDWVVRGGNNKVIVGLLGGFTESHTDYNDQTFNQGADRYDRTNARDNVSGGGGGIYAIAASGPLSFDGLAKIDGYNLEARDTVQQRNCGANPIDREGSVDYAYFVLAGNANYRIPAGENSYWEPTIGLRYTHISYGSQSGTLPLGLEDGDALRLQGGLRYGVVNERGNGDIWVTTLGGYLYSDVVVEGFNAVNSLGFRTAQVDEGKLRVMGQLQTSLVQTNGFIYTATVDVRGGEDVFGVGGKFGIRYEW